MAKKVQTNKEDNIEISIIIVNWNGKEVIKDCLDSIHQSEYDLTKLQVIVVDNASSDNSISIIKKYFPEVVLIKEDKNHGFAEGNNIGFRKAKGKYIAMINNDLVVDKRWFKECVKALEESEVGGVCGKVYEWNMENPKFNTTNKVSTTILKINNWTGRATNYNHESEDSYNMGYLAGAAMMFKKSIADKIGFLDKEYFAYYEETDFCTRMKKAGYKLKYVSKALAWHRVMHSTKKKEGYNEFNLKMMGRNRIKYIMKNSNFIQKLFFPFVLISELIAYNYMIYFKYRKFPCEREFYVIHQKYLVNGIKDNIKGLWK